MLCCLVTEGKTTVSAIEATTETEISTEVTKEEGPAQISSQSTTLNPTIFTSKSKPKVTAGECQRIIIRELCDTRFHLLFCTMNSINRYININIPL